MPGFLVPKLKCLLTVVTLVAAILMQLLVILELHFSPEASPAVPLTAEMRMGDVESPMSPHTGIVNCLESTGQAFQLLWSFSAMLLMS